MKEALVLLPGFGNDEAVWKPCIEHLSDIADMQVIVLDKEDSRSKMADTVLKQAPAKFSLIGHSMGGWVAQEVAAREPSRVSKLILVNTFARANPEAIGVQQHFINEINGGKREEILNMFLNFLLPPRHLAKTDLVQTIQGMFARKDNTVLTRQLAAMCNDAETLPLLKKITAHTLVIHSRLDAIFTLEEEEIITKNIPNACLTIVEECGHVTPLERPYVLIALMRLWLTCKK
jgi:pimeloyl-ACP methyl ester carboxylesterase